MVACIMGPRGKKKEREGGRKKGGKQIPGKEQSRHREQQVHEDHAWCIYRRGQNNTDKRDKEKTTIQ